MADYPKYQYSLFLNGGREEQVVIRAEEWEDLIEAKKNIDKIVEKRQMNDSVKGDPDPKWIQGVDEGMVKPQCPKCKSEMVWRTAKKTGDQFWGCPNFPKCDGSIWPKK